MIRNLLLAALSVMLGLGAIEAYVRETRLWFQPNPAEPGIYQASGIPGVPYVMRPNLDREWGPHRLVTNAEGLRDARDLTTKPANTKRILVVGDSVTFGFGVADADPFPEQLEALLARSSRPGAPRYQVINAGVSGFNAQDEAHDLAYLVPKLKPDLILWALVGNDWDDSLSVDADGKLTSDRPSYGATQDWLGTWGIEGPYLYRDFWLSMDAAHRAWATGQPDQPARRWSQSLDDWLKSRWYTWAFVRSRQIQPDILETRAPAPGKPYYARVQRLDLGGGMWDAPPEFSAIYLSPHYRKRFADAIATGAEVAEAQHIPLVIFGFSIPFEPEMLPQRPAVWFRDITQYVGEPFYRFYLSHNLGWDGHYNRAGHRVIAESILKSLEDLRLTPGVQFQPSRRFYDKTEYWRAYAARREQYISGFIADHVDFAKFENIHQLAGGLYPPRLFPIKDRARLSLILKASAGKLVIRGDNAAAAAQDIGITVETRTQAAILEGHLPSGAFRLALDLPPGFPDPAAKLMDVLVDCKSETCRDITLASVGIDPVR